MYKRSYLIAQKSDYILDAKVLFVVLARMFRIIDVIWGGFFVELDVLEPSTACWCWQATDGSPWFEIARCGLLLVL